MGTIKTLATIFFVGLFFFYLTSAYDLTYTGGVIAEEKTSTRSLLANEAEVVKEYNTHLENVPNFLKTIFKDGKVDLEIEMQSGAVIKRKVTLSNGKITGVQEGSHAKAEYKVWSTEKTLDKVLDAENPTEAFTQALRNEEITIKANKTIGSAKVWLGKLMVNVYMIF